MKAMIPGLLFAYLGLMSSTAAVAGDVDCEITSLAQEYRVGAAPQLSVKLINRGPEAIYLVGSLDGSEELMRYPHVVITASGPGGAIDFKVPRMCDMTNPLRPQDFVRLERGESFDPYMRVDASGFFASYFLYAYRFDAAGEYTLVFHYSTKSKNIGDWGGVEWEPGRSRLERVTALLAGVPAVEIECSVHLTVRERK